MRQLVLGVINRLGAILPKSLQRFIVDFPGMLPLLQKLGGSTQAEILTPEGLSLVINPLFHANLQARQGLADYEPELRSAISALTHPGCCAYDIGANVGIFTLQFSSLVGEGGIVYAFEPEPNNSKCLLETISRNDLKNIRFDGRAIGDSDKSSLFDRRGGAFSGRLVGSTGNRKPTKNVMTVESVSIDSLIAQENFRVPDVMKIDVEGNEGMVLAGMKKTLTYHRPAIICELHGHLGDSIDYVFQILSDCNYRVYPVSEFLKTGNASRPLTRLGNIRHVVALKE
jgi:FkbM family methyltransferase